MTVRLVGPLHEYRVVVDDRQVPFLTAEEVDGGMVNLIFDNRLAVLLPMSVFDDVAAFTATVIEQCFNPELGKRFPFVHEITTVETTL